jgi:hypothetical protein
MVVYTWWCWHIYKGEEVGVEMDQLGEETEAKQVIASDRTQALQETCTSCQCWDLAVEREFMTRRWCKELT